MESAPHQHCAGCFAIGAWIGALVGILLGIVAA
jgi:hypothetical protein